MKRNLHSQNTGRSYGVVLLLAFGAAVFGIMTLHKLRDRRVCNLFVKEKESELDGLKHLLQVPLSPMCPLNEKKKRNIVHV